MFKTAIKSPRMAARLRNCRRHAQCTRESLGVDAPDFASVQNVRKDHMLAYFELYVPGLQGLRLRPTLRPKKTEISAVHVVALGGWI